MAKKMGTHGGQAAVEVLSYASFFLLVFVATISVFLQMQSQEIMRAENAYAQEIAYQFADHIHTSFVAGPGFVQNVTIPPDILGKPYKLMISRRLGSISPGLASDKESGFVYVEWSGQNANSTFSAPTITTAYDAIEADGQIKMDPETDFIIIYSGTPGVRLENIGGTIKFSPQVR